MNSGNWIIDNLMYALKVWNEKLAEIWQLIIQSPQSFKGGTIWNVIVSINGALKAVGTALLVLFFLVGVVKTAGSFSEVKRPEHALKLFVRFAIAKGVITYGLDLMTAIFRIVQGVISTAMHTANIGTVTAITLPTEITNAVNRMPNRNHPLVHYDYERVRTIFQTLPLYGNRTDSVVHVCR